MASVIYVMEIDNKFQVVAMDMKSGEMVELSDLFSTYAKANGRAVSVARVLGVPHRQDMDECPTKIVAWHVPQPVPDDILEMLA